MDLSPSDLFNPAGWLRAFAALICATLIAPAQAQGLSVGTGKRIDGSGRTVEDLRAVGPFSGLVVDGSVDVRVRQGATERVTVRGDDNLVPHVLTEVRAGKLHVGMKEAISYRTRSSLVAEVEVRELSSVAIRGSGDLRAEPLRAGVLDVTLRGSGDAVFERVDAQALAVSIIGSGDLTVRGGKVDSLGVNVTGSGDVRADDAEARQAAVRIRGSGDVALHAVESLQVGIAGSGDVRYKGSPSLQKNIAGSGSVRQFR